MQKEAQIPKELDASEFRERAVREQEIHVLEDRNKPFPKFLYVQNVVMAPPTES